MSNVLDFSKEYAHLMICSENPKSRLGAYPYCTPIPEKYQKEFIHTENGFVKLFCEPPNKSINNNTQSK